MSGTKAGGIRAAKTNKKLHGKDFYSKIGKKGGLVSTPTGGFGSPKKDENGLTGPERARLAGSIGGANSSRAGIKNGEGKTKKRVKKSPEPAPKKKGFLKKIFGGK